MWRTRHVISTCWEIAPTCQTSVRGYLGHFFFWVIFFLKMLKYPWNITAICFDAQQKMFIPNSPKTWYRLPNALKAMGVCLFQGHTYWRMNKNALAWILSSKTYYFTLKYDDLQRTNSEYMEDENSRNWIPVGTGISDTGSGKIHHRNKMVERVDIIF